MCVMRNAAHVVVIFNFRIKTHVASTRQMQIVRFCQRSKHFQLKCWSTSRADIEQGYFTC